MAAFSDPSLRPYHVFLSFRGEDTRTGFTDRLYRALVHAGIHVFRDDDELPRGEDIPSQLLQAIESSRVSVVVFSKNYAHSRWCLDELLKILDCRKSFGQIVLPVFYDVDPSDVRKQTGTFAEAFSFHRQRYGPEDDRLGRWCAALTVAGNLSGWDLQNVAPGSEMKFVQKIVEEVSNKLNHRYMNVATHPIGIDCRVQTLSHFLGLESNGVRIMGIYGMGGIGKTTIAKALYKQFYFRFEGSSFLASIREVSEQHNGLVSLQEKLLSDIVMKKNLKVNNVDRGMNMIKDRLHNRRVLVVLDDVTHLDQLNAVAGNRDWFGPGSRIIVTTRDVHLLKVLGVDERHKAKELDENESLQLFCWHAFGKETPLKDYTEVSKAVVDYAKGLPLALKVLGSFLVEKSVHEWQGTVKKLKRMPDNDIQSKLKISFDGLDDEQKDIFLDIACFLIGTSKDDAIRILDGCGFSAEIGIRVLIDKCLVTIDKEKVRMHDLLQSMARDIIRRESPKEPGKRSRLWCYEDVKYVLEKCTGTETIEGLVLKLYGSEEQHLKTEAFSKMHKLRFLQFSNINMAGSFEHLPEELIWLCWRGFPLPTMPSKFHLEKLVHLDMRYSRLKLVFNDIRVLGKLKVLNLSHSHYLTKTPDFAGLPSLEKLLLKDCTSLVEVHPSIGNLGELVLLNLNNCRMLRKLPNSVSRLMSLKYLILSGCSRLDELHEDLGNMESLVALLASGTAIKQVPSSINSLKNLRQVSIGQNIDQQPKRTYLSLVRSWISRRICPLSLPASLSGLHSLQTLKLVNCHLPDGAIPMDIGSLSSLLSLDLTGNKFSSLPATLSGLTKLKSLTLSNCRRLSSLPKLPTSLVHLYAAHCTSLERISDISNLTELTLVIDGCLKLTEIEGFNMLKSLGSAQLGWCSNLATTLGNNTSWMEGLLRATTGFYCLPWTQIPDWFTYQNRGASVSFTVPPLPGHVIRELRVCSVFSGHEENKNNNTFTLVYVRIMNKTKGLDWEPDSTWLLPVVSEDHLWVGHILHSEIGNSLEGGDVVEVSIDTDDDLTVMKKCGIRVTYENDQGSSSSGGSNVRMIECNETDGVAVGKRKGGHDDDSEAGPSHDYWPEENQGAKRMKYDLVGLEGDHIEAPACTK